MNTKKYVFIVGLGALVSLSGCEGESQDRANAPTSGDYSEPDNTVNNEDDGWGDTQTPLDQSESSDDINITASIRRAIMDDDNMSVNAQNCKIMTDDSGVVTLWGVVNSEEEKNAIDSMAKSVAGVTRVENELEVQDN